MRFKEFYNKVKKKLWSKLVHFTRNTKVYPFIYRSYWCFLFTSKRNAINETCFYTAQPNKGAGIGHQMANWNAGFWYAKKFNLPFAHMPFSNGKWEKFLGFGDNQAKVVDLKNEGYKLRRLPLFSEDKKEEFLLNIDIINSYQGKKVVFMAEQDQVYADQYGIRNDLIRIFNSALSRKFDYLEYKPESFNIAVHVRRTVIIDNKITEETEEVKAKRWLKNDYYEKVLKQVLDNINVNRSVEIYIFSTGKPEEFIEFKKYGNVHFKSEMNEYDSFLHLIKADLLITSKSSFSYKPALMSDGVKLCPRNFWHGYPNTKDWILVENEGTFDVKKLNEAIK